MTQQERQQRSREEIYQAALEEFGAHGYDGTTVEQICRRHGISKGMMYHYYAGKDELFLLCVERTFQALRDHLEREAERMAQAPFRFGILYQHYAQLPHRDWNTQQSLLH